MENFEKLGIYKCYSCQKHFNIYNSDRCCGDEILIKSYCFDCIKSESKQCCKCSYCQSQGLKKCKRCLKLCCIYNTCDWGGCSQSVICSKCYIKRPTYCNKCKFCEKESDEGKIIDCKMCGVTRDEKYFTKRCYICNNQHCEDCRYQLQRSYDKLFNIKKILNNIGLSVKYKQCPCIENEIKEIN